MGKLCVLSEFFFGACYAAWTFSLNFHFSACGVSETNIGVLMAVGYLITAAVSFFAGRLGDQRGYPFVMAGGMVLMSTALALLSMTRQLTLLCLSHGLYCAGLACYMSMEFTQPLSLLREEQRQYGYNTVLLFYFLGSIAGNLLCSALLPLIPDRQDPYRWILLLCSGIYLLMALVKYRMPRQEAAPAADREGGQLTALLKERRVRSYLLFGFFTLGLFTLATGMLNLVLRLWRGMTDGQVVNVFFANSVVGCGAVCILPRLTRRFSLHRISSVIMAVQCLALTAMTALGNGPFVAMILLRSTCCNILYTTVDSPMLESVSAHLRGTYSGVRIFSNHIGVALASVAAGWLVDGGRFALLYLLCGGVALCQNLVYHLLCVPYLLSPEERRPRRWDRSEMGGT